jgi:hypothetical protein
MKNSSQYRAIWEALKASEPSPMTSKRLSEVTGLDLDQVHRAASAGKAFGYWSAVSKGLYLVGANEPGVASLLPPDVPLTDDDRVAIVQLYHEPRKAAWLAEEVYLCGSDEPAIRCGIERLLARAMVRQKSGRPGTYELTSDGFSYAKQLMTQELAG